MPGWILWKMVSIMGRLDSPTFEAPIGVRLNEVELGLLLGLPCVRSQVQAALIGAQSAGRGAEVDLTFYDLGELAGCVALEARHAADDDSQRQLRRLFGRLTRLTRRAWREKFGQPRAVPELLFNAAK